MDQFEGSYLGIFSPLCLSLSLSSCFFFFLFFLATFGLWPGADVDVGESSQKQACASNAPWGGLAAAAADRQTDELPPCKKNIPVST